MCYSGRARLCKIVGKNLFTIVGAPITPKEHAYAKELKALVQELQLTEFVHWQGGVTQAQLVPLLHASDIYIHDGATQSLDKVLVQAVATGLPTISSNKAFTIIAEPIAPDTVYSAHNIGELARKITEIATLPSQSIKDLMWPLSQKFRSAYSIEHLISAIITQYK